MTFISTFILVLISGVVFSIMGYRWGRNDARKEKKQEL